MWHVIWLYVRQEWLLASGNVIVRDKEMNHHITKRSDGKWHVKGEGNKRASVATDTQKEAISLEREILRKQQGELVKVKPLAFHRFDKKNQQDMISPLSSRQVKYLK